MTIAKAKPPSTSYYDGTADEFRCKKRDMQKRYLLLLAEKGTPATCIREASRGKLSSTNLKAWRKNSRSFSIKEYEAILRFKESLFNEAVTRARDGIEEPVIFKGVQSYKTDPRTGEHILDENFEPIPLTVTKKSDLILSKLLETLCKNGEAIVKKAIPDSDHQDPSKVDQIVIDFTAAPASQGKAKKAAIDMHGTIYDPED